MATTSDNKIDKEVGARVRARRTELGMSQTELAEALNVSFQQIQKYEKGKNRISASKLQLMAEVLKAPVALFFGNSAGSGHDEGALIDYLDVRDGLRLIKAFAKIEDRKVAAAVIRLVESLQSAKKS